MKPDLVGPSLRAAVVWGAIAAVGVGVIVLACATGHVHVIEDAIGKQTPGSGTTVAQIVTDLGNLATDTLYVLIPTATIGATVGAISWSAGYQRGQSIVIGACVAGCVGLLVELILK
jgi:hypothetical protein